jgi:hypothetical protein
MFGGVSGTNPAPPIDLEVHLKGKGKCQSRLRWKVVGDFCGVRCRSRTGIKGGSFRTAPGFELLSEQSGEGAYLSYNCF